MIEPLLNIVSWVCFGIGTVLVLVGAVGVLRFPDFYTRMHAAGVTDTLGTDFILLAMALQSDDWITLVKLFLIFTFIVLTSPVSTHAIAHAAWISGFNPLVGRDLHYAEEDENPDPPGAAQNGQGGSSHNG